MPAAVRLLLRTALLALAALPALGHAVTIRCVQTPAAVMAAVNEALASDDAVFMIKLRQGHYDFTTPLPDLALSRANQTIDISGGWSGPNGTCAQIDFGHENTLLSGVHGVRTLLAFVSGSGSTLYVHDLGITTKGLVPGNGACLFASVGVATSLAFERVRFTGCQGGVDSSAAAGEISNAGTLSMRNVLIDHGEAQRNGGMHIYTAGNGITRLAHFTVTGNHSTHPEAAATGLILTNVANGTAHLSNSVLWGNDPGRADLYLSGGLQWLARVHTGSRGGVPASGDITPGSGDPGFISASNPHPRADSILIDSGLIDPVGGSGTYDVEGAPRYVGAGVDVGAYEAVPSDVIFAYGFD